MVLKPFSDHDIHLFESWLTKKHIQQWYEHPEDWMLEVRTRHTDFAFISHFIAYVNHKPIGFGQLYPYSKSGENWQGDVEIEGTYSIDYLIGEESYLGKGYGKQLVKELIRLVFSIESAKRIIVQPEETNEKSCGVLMANGFVFDEKNKLFLLSMSGISTV